MILTGCLVFIILFYVAADLESLMQHSAIIIDGEIYEFTVDGLIKHSKGSAAAVKYVQLFSVFCYNSALKRMIRGKWLNKLNSYGRWNGNGENGHKIGSTLQESHWQTFRNGLLSRQNIRKFTANFHLVALTRAVMACLLTVLNRKQTYDTAANNCHDFVAGACNVLGITVPDEIKRIISKCRDPK